MAGPTRCKTIAVLMAIASPPVAGGFPPDLIALRQAFSASQADIAASSAVVSGDGSVVAFASRERLLPADTGLTEDLYVFDRGRGTLTLETLAVDGSPVDGDSANPRLSGDGRFLVFESSATSLTADPDTNGTVDVFVRDRQAGITRRLSIGATGGESNGRSLDPSISEDGRTVAFASMATNLLTSYDANGPGRDVYVRRLDTGELKRESVRTDGHQPSEGASFGPTLSGDGLLVAFTSTAELEQSPRHPAANTPSAQAVYVRDRTSGTTTCISCNQGGVLPHSRAYDPHLSDDGRFVVFTAATGEASRRQTPRINVVLYDRAAAMATLVTRRANANSWRPRISGNGRFIAFESLASDLTRAQRCSDQVADDNLLTDIYLFDRQSGRFSRVSGGPQEWWVPSVGPWLDAEGMTIVFSSRQPVEATDMTTDFDLFVRSLEGLTQSQTPNCRR